MQCFCFQFSLFIVWLCTPFKNQFVLLFFRFRPSRSGGVNSLPCSYVTHPQNDKNCSHIVHTAVTFFQKWSRVFNVLFLIGSILIIVFGASAYSRSSSAQSNAPSISQLNINSTSLILLVLMRILYVNVGKQSIYAS